jgi:hypothetical protein
VRDINQKEFAAFPYYAHYVLEDWSALEALVSTPCAFLRCLPTATLRFCCLVAVATTLPTQLFSLSSPPSACLAEFLGALSLVFTALQALLHILVHVKAMLYRLQTWLTHALSAGG